MIQAFGDIFKNTSPQHRWLFWKPSKYFSVPAQVWISLVSMVVYKSRPISSAGFVLYMRSWPSLISRYFWVKISIFVTQKHPPKREEVSPPYFTGKIACNSQKHPTVFSQIIVVDAIKIAIKINFTLFFTLEHSKTSGKNLLSNSHNFPR